MSLLMEALKRAEENKQDAAKNVAAAAPAGLRLEPLQDRRPGEPPVTLPDLAEHLDAVDADLAASAKAPPPPAAGLPPPAAAKPADPGRDAVRNAFAAKEAAPQPRRALWLTLGLLGAAAAGIGGYVWYQTQALSRSSLTLPAPPARPAAAPAEAPAAQPPLAALPAAVPPPPTEIPAAPALERIAAPPAQSLRRPEAAAPVVDGSAAEAAPVRLVRSRPEVDPDLGRGYHSLQSGNIQAARADYERALRRDPKNVDALLGLAAIAQREGRAGEAADYWQQAFEADPKDAAAQAAVVAMAAPADPVAAESRLKTLLAAQPESGPLNFALGNLLSRQSRWAEAQQAYFNAVAADGDNPDYLFNLAVSLDHLRQPRLAAQHYRLALEAGGRRAAAFDREQARQRLLVLQP